MLCLGSIRSPPPGRLSMFVVKFAAWLAARVRRAGPLQAQQSDL